MRHSLPTRLARYVLWRTGLGRRLAERYWQPRSHGPGYEQVYYREEEVFAQLPTDFDDPAYSAFIAEDSARWSRQQAFVVAVDDVLLEPERLLGTRGRRELVEQTVPYKFDRPYPFILPHLLRRGPTTRLPVAFLYDGYASRNYYHHFVDAVGDLSLLPQAQLPPDVPLLVNRFVWEQAFFQYLLGRSPRFRALNWRVVEADEWVQVGKLYVAQPLFFAPGTWQFMRDLYNLPDQRPRRRVFLNRDRRRFGRYLANETEAVALLRQLGFEEVFAENLTVPEQAALFMETEYLVALTGAGLIQQFFMNPRHGHVLELMPANRLMPEYYWQAYTLGLRYYDVLVGGPMREGKDYPVDLARLETAVRRMLVNAEPGRVYGRTVLPSAS